MTGDPGQQVVAAKPADALVLGDAYLLTEDMNGELAVPRLSLVLDTAGLTVRKPDGEAAATVNWPDITAVRADGRMRTPVGTPGVVVEIATTIRTHRFMVPTNDPTALEREVSRWAQRRSATSPWRTTALTVVTGILVVALIALIVLIATGTVTL